MGNVIRIHPATTAPDVTHHKRKQRMTVNKYTIGDSLRLARTAAHMTGDDIAKKLGLSAPAYRRYERDEVVPAIDTITRLAEIYGCTIDALCKHGGRQLSNKINRGNVQVDIDDNEKFSIEINIKGFINANETKEKELDQPAQKAKPKKATG